jgi:hypothetical protein
MVLKMQRIPKGIGEIRQDKQAITSHDWRKALQARGLQDYREVYEISTESRSSNQSLHIDSVFLFVRWRRGFFEHLPG